MLRPVLRVVQSAHAAEPAINWQHVRLPADAPASDAKRYGFLVNWDSRSFTSLKAHHEALDAVLPIWLHLADASGALRHDDERKERTVLSWAARNAPALEIIPVLNNFDPVAQQWDGAKASAVLLSPTARQALIGNAVQYVSEQHLAGLVVDFQDLPQERQAEFADFINQFSAALHAIDRMLLVKVAADNEDAGLAELAATEADAIVLTIYDEHSETPGPLAGQGWFEWQLDEAFAEIDGSRIIIALGSYAVDWSSEGDLQELSVEEAWSRLEASGADLEFEQNALNPTFSYQHGHAGDGREVWFLDAATVYNQVSAGLAMQPKGLALWRLGAEDPAAWASFGRGRTADAIALKSMKVSTPGTGVLYRGEGEVLRVTAQARPGAREFKFDKANNLITDQTITEHARPTTVSRWGLRRDNVIALTFDDGPSNEYTASILDVLATHGVPATFFVCGINATQNPDLLRRMYREGHDIGNHTFSHPNVAMLSQAQLELELTATQRVIEAEVGVRTTIFRPPFATDMEPETGEEAQALLQFAALGYTTIGMRIDPLDWARPGAQAIVDQALAQLNDNAGNVILLHDAGGDRSQTVQALPLLIAQLKARGYSFVTVHELLKLGRDDIMPPVPASESMVATINQVGFLIWRETDHVLGILFILGIALGGARLLVIAGGALFQARQVARRAPLDWQPAKFAVLIPAFNEQTVICKSIRSVLDSRLTNFEIIVVDDGSSDDTAAVARAAFGDNPRVKIHRKPNGGKAAALNFALERTDAAFVVVQDADTLFEPDALRLLMRHFADPQVGAVAGTTIVGNTVSWITQFQALEYATSQNLDRRAMELVNAITVVPGAIGAWRRDAIRAVGGFTDDTLAEDADATVRLERAGWRVLYEADAYARTEAPETLRSFLKQRFRWMFGMLQTAYKHRDVYLHRGAWGVKLCTLPNIVLFQFLFALVSPAMDLVLVWSLLSTGLSYAMHPQAGMAPHTLTIVAYWASFQMFELAVAALAILLSKQSGLWRLLPLIVAQRVCYRQLIYWTAIRSTAAALKGHLVGWNKLQRTGSVKIAPEFVTPAAANDTQVQKAA